MSCLIVTDLHQQGADHCVNLAHVRDAGHLVTTQYISLQGLCADLQIYVTCVHTNILLFWKQSCIDYHSTFTFCIPRQNSFPSAFQPNSLSSQFLHTLLFVFFLPPPFPILFALINPHLLPYYTASPPYGSISRPLLSFLHSPQSFTWRTSTDHPLRERFLSVSSEILPDLLVQVIVSIPLRGC